MSIAFHRRLRFRRNLWQRIWDFRVTAQSAGFWRTVWAAIKNAAMEDFQ